MNVTNLMMTFLFGLAKRLERSIIIVFMQVLGDIGQFGNVLFCKILPELVLFRGIFHFCIEMVDTPLIYNTRCLFLCEHFCSTRRLFWPSYGIIHI